MRAWAGKSGSRWGVLSTPVSPDGKPGDTRSKWRRGEAAVERVRQDLEGERHRGGGRELAHVEEMSSKRSTWGGGMGGPRAPVRTQGRLCARGRRRASTGLLPWRGRLSDNRGHVHVYPASSLSAASPDGQPASPSGARTWFWNRSSVRSHYTAVPSPGCARDSARRRQKLASPRA